ncbi:hypothetical protein PCANC_03965 [Puccinia coronata f. sp. avenae]|uniref:NADH:ubiquinone oxidoreductase intermediate-associated protein 30 domain-containing protein n=1 Tax=Puccinia coronata f. sp. avenae TaxID=200324 RepID=A0A2N5TFP4_9BASI|nr:hypothetical protein PCANC_03965 [Puccinia coronata f. sp. avenae]PLW24332.1 hypothetical protein PCASD_06539 [Puccinia coronata f. sp. avenae]PLW49779.1 hypothetical protein PCASD_01545 [Puccinia coronata f. sp. avenae]
MGTTLSLLIHTAFPGPTRPPQTAGRLQERALITDSWVIFGSSTRPWNIENWQEVSDRVRGGRSEGTLAYLHPSSRSEGVVFAGTLDSKTLRGAGFASQAYRQTIPLGTRGDHYTAFVLQVQPLEHAHSENNNNKNNNNNHVRTFTFVVSDRPRSDPAATTQSSLVYQFDFSLPPATPAAKLDHTILIRIPFEKLIPTYRGRPKKDEKPFVHPHELTQISFMARSFFDQQNGPFHLNILRLSIE